MNGATSPDNQRNNKYPIKIRTFKKNRSPAIWTNDEEAAINKVFSSADFPPLGALTTTQQTTSSASSSLYHEQTAASGAHQPQLLEQNTNILQFENSRINNNLQPLMPSIQIPSSTAAVRKPSGKQKTPGVQSKHFISSTTRRVSNSNVITNTHLIQSDTMNPNAVAGNSSSTLVTAAAAVPPPPPQPLTLYEKQIYEKLCEIILTIHKSKEFVSREHVQQELFRFYRINSWYELRVQPSRFDAFMNLTDRQKSVIFYLHVFEQTFNLCTLNDLGFLIARFMKVDKYDDLRLGPLDKNPEVQRIFGYQPTSPDQPIPTITTGQVIKKFMDFQKVRRQQRTTLDTFLDFLVQDFMLQSREELGLFCKSYPYLIQVTNNVRRDLDSHIQQEQLLVQQEFIEDVRKHLEEFKEKMHDELELSSFNKKKTPTAVFNYLTSIVQKYLNFIPQQPALYTILIQLRDDEMLRCLLNLSIYLGTIEKPEVFIAELKRLIGYQDKILPMEELMTVPETPITMNKMSKKDRKKLKAILEQQQLQHSHVSDNEQITTANAVPVSTSFSSSFFASQAHQPKAAVSLKQLCSDIYRHLVCFDTPPSIQHLLQIDEDICNQHGVTSFSAFADGDNEYDDIPENFVSFLNKYRDTIDPNGELSVYEQTKSMDDRSALYSFVQQLTMINDDGINEECQPQHVTLTHGHVNAEQLHISADKRSAIEKAIKHKFGESINFRKGNQIIRKAKRKFHKNKHTIIRFEESVLDLNSLNQLDVCSMSLNVNETQLCQLILHCPLMANLYTWLQWINFFQPKYGALQSFITKHEIEFKDLQLFETSTGELYRLPIDASLATFERELDAMHIRSAVGHLCSLIIQEELITRFPINVYRTSMETWFRHLQSLATLQNDHTDPMQHILEFLMCLPILIGQSRFIEELILLPLDKVFDDVSDNQINPRTKLWNLANAQQRIKLEVWGHKVDISEWKNEKKWLGGEESEERSIIQSAHELIRQQIIDTVNPAASTTTVNESLSATTTKKTTSLSTLSTTANIDNASDSIQAASQHIESIRRGFGVDSGLDAASQSIITNLRGMVERSLERLSNDLYLEQGHFVLELIQNADDNQYTSDIMPTLRFTLSPERILVCNNEIGFQPNNIMAICNVGASTKGKHKQGYAGHKGIGFKSVFMVSHRPEIHSRNYHICFDTVNGTEQIGYTQPIWLDQYEEVLPNVDEWTTCIRLPIKKDARDARLKENFKKIESIFLLFLNRLRKIEIINQYDISETTNNNRIFTRIDHDQGQIIELEEKYMNGTIISNLWLVVKKVIEVPADIKIKLRDVKGDVDTTIIAIAYPLNGIQDSSSSTVPPTQPVFAYLPLCSYGFRFILQADFEVPANRQEILHDNLWNEWLKSEMTCLLSLAYYQFEHLHELLVSSKMNTQINNQITPIQMIKYFLKFFPLQNESKPFFNKFVDKSIQLLRGIIKLPISQQNEKGETVTDWVSPSQCVIVQDQFIRKILSQDLLLSHFNSYYVHEELVHECDEQILLKLGCRQLDFSDITCLIEMSYQKNEQQHLKTPAAIEQIAQWLACLDYSLQEQREEMNYKERESETIAKLKKLKIIPLKDHSRLVSVDEFDKHAISFPLSKSNKFAKHLKLVLDDLPTVDEQLINFIEDKYPRRAESIQRLFQNLGITREHNIRDIYRQHMLPIMSDETRWSSKSESILIAYVLCIYEYIYAPNINQFENELKTLQNKMIVKTRNNKFVSLGSPDVIVHLTLKYDCRTSLESLSSSNHEFLFISDDYINEFYHTEAFRTGQGARDFVKFLKSLNINDFLHVTINEKSFLTVQQLADTKWAYLIPQLSEMVHDTFIIQDCSCDEFNKLVSPSGDNQTVNLELCVRLLQYLDSHYRDDPSYYAGSVSLFRPHKFARHTPIKGIESSFCLSLRQHAWIPVHGDILLKSSEVYLLPPNDPTSVFRRYVPHIDESKVRLKEQEFIYNILGIRSKIEHRTIFELFMKWSCNLDSESLSKLINQANTSDIIPCTLPKTFRQSCLDTIDNFRQIYHFLASNDTTCNLLSRFRSWPIVFIPRNQTTGDFLFVEQTFWNDPASLLSSQDAIADSNGRIPIQSYYNDNSLFHSLFVEILHVELHPTVDDYLPLLSIQQDIQKIWQIIEIITKLAMEQNKQIEVREKCLDIAFIPCMDNKQKLVKYIDRPYYPHDVEIANQFSDVLSIIKLPEFPIMTSFQEQFRSLFNIESLGKVVQTIVQVENEQTSTSLLDFYSSAIDLIQDFLLKKQLISQPRSAHLSTVFARMHFVCVDRIDLSYCLGNDIIKSASTSYRKDSYVDEQSGKFFILKKFERSEMRYIDAMVEFIVEDEMVRSQLTSCIKKLLQIYEKDDQDGLGKVRENLMVDNEPKWIIPKEIKKEIPIPEPIIEQEKPKITAEELEELMEERSIRPKLPPKKVTTEENTNVINSFPAKAGICETSDKTTPKIHNHPKDNNSTDDDNKSSKSYSNNQSHDQEHVVQRSTTTEHNGEISNAHETNNEERRPNKGPYVQSQAPIAFSGPILSASANFEDVAVSTLTNIDLDAFTSTDNSSNISASHPIGTEADRITGRLGEELVFRYLQSKYPDDDIKWMNQDAEHGTPYDIHLIVKSDNNQERFIEVKTTRSFDHNSFPVSIGEVEHLLQHPSNYYIYRVYYADKAESSIITIMNRIKLNLERKYLKLLMTFESKPADGQK
ncbi:unnamed protein product [Rotaria socialis]|uniref:Protein NO VEIN C-terminal domain-containing protein n=1 Tax=Rotaria socialis TaxID=392032 RepID=A0A819WDH0_9BILA|nr:unnamed protein product [Rotaria socialis]CAF3627713.1 unnamed protein product [Rotaria socialis]CAF4096665.1 unnamed protein product [Rotaria socialis]CAF4121975.1 unnamed protein product [Rotaria socialis]